MKMMVEMNVTLKGITKKRLPATQGTYCWIPGRSDNVGHTSTTCKSPVEGYDVEVTWNNKNGGICGAREINDKARLQIQ